ADPHCFVHSVNRKWRINVPSPEASVAHALCGFVKRGGARILRSHSINFVAVRSGYHRVRSFPCSHRPVAGRGKRRTTARERPTGPWLQQTFQIIACAPFRPERPIRFLATRHNADLPQVWLSSLPTSRSSGGNG